MTAGKVRGFLGGFLVGKKKKRCEKITGRNVTNQRVFLVFHKLLGIESSGSDELWDVFRSKRYIDSQIFIDLVHKLLNTLSEVILANQFALLSTAENFLDQFNILSLGLYNTHTVYHPLWMEFVTSKILDTFIEFLRRTKKKKRGGVNEG
jgi:hypothetical protein